MYEVKRVADDEGLCANWKIVNLNPIVYSKTLFLDRDGVIILNHGYVSSLNRVDLIVEIVELMVDATIMQRPVSIITNQAGVAHGLFSEEDVVNFNLELLHFLYENHGIKINNLLYCPSHPKAVILNYRKNCNCRKPKTRLFESSLKQTNSKPELSVFIGDQESDRKAAERLNMQFISFPKDFEDKKYILNALLQ